MAKKTVARAKRAVAKVKKAATKARARVMPIPKGMHAVTPSLVIRGAADAIEFYKKAFGAKEKGRMAMPDGRIMHAEIVIGDSRIMMADEMPEMGSKSPLALGGTPSSLLIYTRNVDALVAQAANAGAKVTMPPADMFWGDRYAKLQDPFGHEWEVATHIEDVSNREMAKRAQAFMSAPPPPRPA